MEELRPQEPGTWETTRVIKGYWLFGAHAKKQHTRKPKLEITMCEEHTYEKSGTREKQHANTHTHIRKHTNTSEKDTIRKQPTCRTNTHEKHTCEKALCFTNTRGMEKKCTKQASDSDSRRIFSCFILSIVALHYHICTTVSRCRKLNKDSHHCRLALSHLYYCVFIS